MCQPPEGVAGVCEHCLGLGTVIQTLVLATFLNFAPPRKAIDFGTVDLPECQEQRRQATVIDMGWGSVPKSTVFRGGGFRSKSR